MTLVLQEFGRTSPYSFSNPRGYAPSSGNDAAYAMAAYVGRKSLNDPDAEITEAVIDFVRMMNEKAVAFGVKNSCFKTPDGYDALGQYTTAYDMGLISLEALKNDTIMEICKKGRSRNVFVSGEDITWYNTNRLIKKMIIGIIPMPQD